MRQLLFYSILSILLLQCQSGIKNEDANLSVEDGTEITSNTEKIEETNKVLINKFNGFWVGYFLKDMPENDQEKNLYVDEGFMWERENKINISIDKIEEGIVTGHSVVAGNDRPFTGTIKDSNGIYSFILKEPGDDKYDGTFNFTIRDSVLEGTWTAFKKIDIPKRKYSLKRKTFQYNPDIKLEIKNSYVNWEKSKKYYEKELEEFSSEFATATDKIYQLNASNKLLTKADVQNLKKGDLLIIRNTIYARHGYSFKNRPLRVFFDAQEWYIPVFADIKANFTDIEKKNIELLLRYEKNAKEYYDYFGRG